MKIKKWFEIIRVEYVNGEWKETKVANIISSKYTNEYLLQKDIVDFLKVFIVNKSDKFNVFIGTSKKSAFDKDVLQQMSAKDYQYFKKINAILEDGTLNKENVYYFVSFKREIKTKELKILRKEIKFHDFE